MPTYSYACTACSHTFDVHQSFSDAALTVCPECEGRLRKVFGNVGVVFKGSGFYRTDSRAESRSGARRATTTSTGTKSAAADAGSSTKSAAADAGSSSTTTEPKPAASSASAAKPAASA